MKNRTIGPAEVMERFGVVDLSLSRKHEGNGLGLPLSKQLAELHGGTLMLESTVDVGPRPPSPCPESAW